MRSERLDAALQPFYEQRDIRTADVLAAVVKAFNEDLNETLNPEAITERQADQLRRYLVEAEMESDVSLLYRRPILSHLPLYVDMASKIRWLSQRPCTSCTIGALGPVNFPIEIPPWSHQASSNVGPALKAAVEANPRYAEHYRARLTSDPLCVRLVFVLEDGATMKDCDNMAKGLLDAFEGLIYKNDRQVDHLDLVRVHSAAGSHGYILVRYASTTVNDHSDVIHPMHAQIAWMDTESLDISRYLARPAAGKPRSPD